MKLFEVEIANNTGGLDVMTIPADDLDAAIEIADARCAMFNRCAWGPTGDGRLIDPLTYLAATEARAMPAVVAGLRADGVSVPAVRLGQPPYHRDWP